MFMQKMYKTIDNISHRGKVPNPQGQWLWLVDKCPFWGSFVVLLIVFCMETFGFAWLYSAISSLSIMECFNYSLFSVLGKTVTSSIRNASIINQLIAVQLVLTNCIVSFYMAIVLYKLMNIKPKLIQMENHVVFDPTTGTLRLRIANVSRFIITNAHVDATIRIHVPKGGRHATADLKIKRSDINSFRPYSAWNIASKPFHPENENDAFLNIKRFDEERVYEFIPDLLQEKYRSDDPEIAKNLDYRNLDITISVKSPVFGADWVYQKSFYAKDFVCGKLISLDPHVPGKNMTDWSNWESYDDMSESYCVKCPFDGHCGIVKKNQKYAVIN